MATFTTVGICNHALVLCGASPITSLTEDSTNARALNAVYETARQGFLTECRWTFALTRSMLATVATSSIAWLHDEEAYAYTRPTSALRIWQMSDIEAIWREEGGYIISNTASLGTLATFDQTELGLWRPKAMTAFIDKLCSDISFTILNSPTKAQAFLEKYQKISLPAAMAEESQTGTHQEVIDDYWLKSKYGNDGNPARSYS
jgi:hypothetical protein